MSWLSEFLALEWFTDLPGGAVFGRDPGNLPWLDLLDAPPCYFGPARAVSHLSGLSRCDDYYGVNISLDDIAGPVLFDLRGVEPPMAEGWLEQADQWAAQGRAIAFLAYQEMLPKLGAHDVLHHEQEGVFALAKGTAHPDMAEKMAHVMGRWHTGAVDVFAPVLAKDGGPVREIEFLMDGRCRLHFSPRALMRGQTGHAPDLCARDGQSLGLDARQGVWLALPIIGFAQPQYDVIIKYPRGRPCARLMGERGQEDGLSMQPFGDGWQIHIWSVESRTGGQDLIIFGAAGDIVSLYAEVDIPACLEWNTCQEADFDPLAIYALA